MRYLKYTTFIGFNESDEFAERVLSGPHRSDILAYRFPSFASP